MGQINFLGIGAQKAGTTWLHAALNLHPDVSLHPLKELHFFDAKYFDKDFGERRKQRALKSLQDLRRLQGKAQDVSDSSEDALKSNESQLNGIAIKALERLGLEDLSYENYFSLFESLNNKIVGEITPKYACIPEHGVKEMRENLGDIKVVYMIRNPVKRAWSQFRMQYQKDLKQAVEKKRVNKGVVEIFKTHKRFFLKGSDVRTDYRSTIEIYSTYFSHFHLIFYDDLCNSPSQVLQDVCNFLEITYDQDIFLPLLNQRQREGIKLEMPKSINALLSKRYKDQENYIQEAFGKTLIY